jgi:hypothetical protein
VLNLSPPYATPHDLRKHRASGSAVPSKTGLGLWRAAQEGSPERNAPRVGAGATNSRQDASQRRDLRNESGSRTFGVPLDRTVVMQRSDGKPHAPTRSHPSLPRSPHACSRSRGVLCALPTFQRNPRGQSKPFCNNRTEGRLAAWRPRFLRLLGAKAPAASPACHAPRVPGSSSRRVPGGVAAKSTLAHDGLRRLPQEHAAVYAVPASAMSSTLSRFALASPRDRSG